MGIRSSRHCQDVIRVVDILDFIAKLEMVSIIATDIIELSGVTNRSDLVQATKESIAEAEKIAQSICRSIADIANHIKELHVVALRLASRGNPKDEARVVELLILMRDRCCEISDEFHNAEQQLILAIAASESRQTESRGFLSALFIGTGTSDAETQKLQNSIRAIVSKMEKLSRLKVQHARLVDFDKRQLKDLYSIVICGYRLKLNTDNNEPKDLSFVQDLCALTKLRTADGAQLKQRSKEVKLQCLSIALAIKRSSISECTALNNRLTELAKSGCNDVPSARCLRKANELIQGLRKSEISSAARKDMGHITVSIINIVKILAELKEQYWKFQSTLERLKTWLEATQQRLNKETAELDAVHGRQNEAEGSEGFIKRIVRVLFQFREAPSNDVVIVRKRRSFLHDGIKQIDYSLKELDVFLGNTSQMLNGVESLLKQYKNLKEILRPDKSSVESS